MIWTKQLWGLKGTDYYPGPNGEKLYTRWKKSEEGIDKYLLDICEIPTNGNYKHVTNFTIYQDKSASHELGMEKDVYTRVYENAEHYSTVKKRPMKKEELNVFFNIFLQKLKDFPISLRGSVIRDLREYYISARDHLS